MSPTVTSVSQPLTPTRARLREWLRAATIAAADIVHARGDEFAYRQGWTVTRTGMTGRVYRDARFDGRSSR